MDDPRLDGKSPPAADGKRPRRQYFREPFRLQRELVATQDWVSATKHHMVVLFEGRDAAGKGGVIKRITQLNPRVCSVVALQMEGTGSALARDVATMKVW